MRRVLATWHGMHRDLQGLQDTMGAGPHTVFSSIVHPIKEVEHCTRHTMARAAGPEYVGVKRAQRNLLLVSPVLLLT